MQLEVPWDEVWQETKSLSKDAMEYILLLKQRKYQISTLGGGIGVWKSHLHEKYKSLFSYVITSF